MKLFIISIFAAVILTANASAKPGGYILKGGVNPKILADKPAGYFHDAQSAGRFAQQQKLEEEQSSFGSGFEFRNTKRQVAAQPVTFFTTQENHAALTSLAHHASEQQFHQKREVYQQPLYYNEYHNRR